MTDVHILGSGAMGCLWASYLSPTHDVTMIQKRRYEDGFHFQYLPDGITFNTTSIEVSNINKPIKKLILATKAYDALNAMTQVSPYIESNTQVVLLQNGLGSQQDIAEQFPHIRLFACSSTEGVYKPDSRTVVHAGKGVNKIGAMNQYATLEALQEWLPSHCYHWEENIEQILWQKFMINCAINPLTHIYQCANGQLLENPEFLSHMQVICDEIDLITKAKQYSLPRAIDLAKQVCLVTAENYSSMLQDVRNHRKTEIDYITGYLLKQSLEYDIKCPENLALYQSISEF